MIDARPLSLAGRVVEPGGPPAPRGRPAPPLRVLVACEYSGVVRDAFTALGHDAVSCDLLDSETPGKHYKGDARDLLGDGWDLLIAHPPCTYLCNSGVRWLHTEPGRWQKMEDAAAFFRAMLDAPVPFIAVENPIMHGHARRIVGQRQSAIVHPWEFGHDESKATCLWLKGLPPLLPTDIRSVREQRLWRLSPGAARSKERSRTYSGIAAAMADQWGAFVSASIFGTAGSYGAIRQPRHGGVAAVSLNLSQIGQHVRQDLADLHEADPSVVVQGSHGPDNGGITCAKTGTYATAIGGKRTT